MAGKIKRYSERTAIRHLNGMARMKQIVRQDKSEIRKLCLRISELEASLVEASEKQTSETLSMMNSKDETIAQLTEQIGKLEIVNRRLSRIIYEKDARISKLEIEATKQYETGYKDGYLQFC